MSAARRFPWWIYWVLFVLIAVFSFFPIALTVIAAGIANANDCTISEGVLSPCMIDGNDWGPDLQAMGIAFWYLLVTWPIGIVLSVVWLIVLLLHRRGWRKRNTVRT